MNRAPQDSCRGCGAPIQWLKLGERWHPCEVAEKTIVVDGKLVTGPESHFAHCPKAGAFRRTTASKGSHHG